MPYNSALDIIPCLCLLENSLASLTPHQPGFLTHPMVPSCGFSYFCSFAIIFPKAVFWALCSSFWVLPFLQQIIGSLYLSPQFPISVLRLCCPLLEGQINCHSHSLNSKCVKKNLTSFSQTYILFYQTNICRKIILLVFKARCLRGFPALVIFLCPVFWFPLPFTYLQPEPTWLPFSHVIYLLNLISKYLPSILSWCCWRLSSDRPSLWKWLAFSHVSLFLENPFSYQFLSHTLFPFPPFSSF